MGARDIDAMGLRKAEGSSLDTPYVVKFHNFFELDEPQPIFTFEHPNWDEVIDNTR